VQNDEAGGAPVPRGGARTTEEIRRGQAWTARCRFGDAALKSQERIACPQGLRQRAVGGAAASAPSEHGRSDSPPPGAARYISVVVKDHVGAPCHGGRPYSGSARRGASRTPLECPVDRSAASVTPSLEGFSGLARRRAAPPPIQKHGYPGAGLISLQHGPDMGGISIASPPDQVSSGLRRQSAQLRGEICEGGPRLFSTATWMMPVVGWLG